MIIEDQVNTGVKAAFRENGNSLFFGCKVEIKNIMGVVGVDKVNPSFYRSFCNGANTLRRQKIKDDIKFFLHFRCQCIWIIGI
jgi:hypothetical protein